MEVRHIADYLNNGSESADLGILWRPPEIPHFRLIFDSFPPTGRIIRLVGVCSGSVSDELELFVVKPMKQNLDLLTKTDLAFNCWMAVNAMPPITNLSLIRI